MPNGRMPDAIPIEVQLMAKEFIRTCQRHNVALSGFLFQANPPLVMMFGNLKETPLQAREVHNMLFDTVLCDPSAVTNVNVFPSDA